jgi:aminodeoxyfutalosine deaminase
MSADFTSFVRALPKVELHLHLLGSASPQTVVGLAARYPGSPVPADLDLLREYYEYRDFPHFIDVYKNVAALVRDGDDIRVLTVGLARDLVRTRAVADMSAHPVAAMLSAGLTDNSRRVLCWVRSPRQWRERP